jgi:hypothetical protein
MPVFLIFFTVLTTVTGSPTTISTLISTDTAENITFYSAVLKATVDPQGYPTTVCFELGTDTTYGFTIIPSPDTITGSGPVSFQVEVTGIASAQTFHFRAKASNSLGIFYGQDVVFITETNPPR